MAMALKLGAYTACLHDRPLAEALEVLESNGLTSVEINTGGFIPSPHCHVDLLLSSEQARTDYLAEFSSRGMELTGLNCNGNPLNPLPGIGPKHADDLLRTIELAGLLGVQHVVTMSGTPGSDPDARYPSWVVNPWDGVYMDVLDYQWGVAAEFWKEIDALARGQRRQGRRRDAPAQPRVLSGHAEEAGGSDQRDARRRRDGPVAPDVAGHGHPRVHPVSGPAGVPRRRQRRDDHPRGRHPRRARHLVRAGARRRPGQGSHRLRLLVQRLAGEPGWKFVAVGVGHDVEYWTEFLRALAEVDPDMAVNIEHEDASTPASTASHSPQRTSARPRRRCSSSRTGATPRDRRPTGCRMTEATCGWASLDTARAVGTSTRRS